MKRIALVALLLVAAAWWIPSIRNAGAQRRYYDPPRGLYTQQLVRRVAELEQRVDRLERLLPGGAGALATVTVDGAQQQIANARDRLAYSKEMFRKGYISQVQLDAERFELKRAEMVLKFAQAASAGEDTSAIASSIEILDAEHDLALAQRQVKFAEQMLTGGLTNPTALDGYRRTVEAAQRRLERARARSTEQ